MKLTKIVVNEWITDTCQEDTECKLVENRALPAILIGGDRAKEAVEKKLSCEPKPCPVVEVRKWRSSVDGFDYQSAGYESRHNMYHIHTTNTEPRICPVFAVLCSTDKQADGVLKTLLDAEEQPDEDVPT